MNPIAFIDTDIKPKSRKILTIGGTEYNGKSFHSTSVPDCIFFIKGTKFICVHYFITRQNLVSKLTCGDLLTIKGDSCTTVGGASVLKFSRHFLNTIESAKQKGYELKEAKVNFIVYWKKEDAEEEVKIILPELIFVRK